MKIIVVLLLVVLSMITLSSCFLFGDFTTHPDMVEYTENEILEVAKDKYGVTEWIFTGTEIMGEATYDAEGVDHTQTEKFIVYDYYILYEKNIETE